jgi:predicted proteasome-type protease
MSGCRNLDLNALNTFRRARNLTEVSTVDCPGFANVDLRFSKSLRIGSQRAELIAQLFNVFDHANFSTANTSITAANDPATGRPLFGSTTSLQPNINAPSRQAEFAIRFQF